MKSVKKTIPRHKTAIPRSELSRPLRIGLETGLITQQASVFDYGCGLGHDVDHLRELDVSAEGWDPVHHPAPRPREADVVNLGYVVNVVEDPGERAKALLSAWNLARGVLIVSARLRSEVRLAQSESLGDGCVTGLGTFQKFYDQSELRNWIDETTSTKSIAAAPGVFLVFRDETLKQSYLSTRYRRRRAAPRPRKSDVLFEGHREILEPLIEFVTRSGRLPAPHELAKTDAINDVFGSVRKAFTVIRRVTGKEQWEQIRRERQDELLLQLALMRFTGRPKFGVLPQDIQLDMRAFFSSYSNACHVADELLFSAGDMSRVDAEMKSAPVGKLTGSALYVHVDALRHLASVLQVYEGCASLYAGAVEAANIIKLHRRDFKVSYLCYPSFDEDPHPALTGALLVSLGTLDVTFRDYSRSENPPILHRKEQFVSPDYPLREKFERLTRQEETWGLFDDTKGIGRQRGWTSALEAKGAALKGHRLIRAR